MNNNNQPHFSTILNKRISRRNFVKTSSAVAVTASLTACGVTSGNSSQSALSGPVTLPFEEVPQGIDEFFHVASGHDHEVLLSWGDGLFSDAKAFDPHNQTEESQLRQFGYNNDFIGFLPLPIGSKNSDHGLLTVNHEYTNNELMFPGSPKSVDMTLAQTKVDIVAHGLSVVEIKKVSGQWQVVRDSSYNRRITPYTEMQMTGPAAKSHRLKTAISHDGVRTLGTYGNCAGGVTPWGTILTGEENIDYFFAGDFSQSDEKESLQRLGMKANVRSGWPKYFERWDLSKHPGEGLHMGWVVEIDPYDPQSIPKKRTMLGRCKHEGCNVFINSDGHVVAYTGDDQRFEYLYKFVSKNKYDPNNRKANMELLEEGTLYCARFDDDGTVSWLPLVFGQNGLNPEYGFNSQADVLIDSRKAADILGATPMDRPEDVEVNPVNGKVYVMLTNNHLRENEQVDAVNPRATNEAGQIVELSPPTGDHTQSTFKWDMFLLAGKKSDPTTTYHPETSDNGWLACPDNCAFDRLGNLWIATDGAPKFGVADGVWATEVTGPHRGLTKRFLRTPIGAELCGPFFTPNSENFFCSVQHPGDKSTYDNPNTRWPDFDETLPPRPSVVVITKQGGGRVGGA